MLQTTLTTGCESIFDNFARLCSVSSQMTERRESCCSDPSFLFIDGPSKFQEEYLEYSPSNDPFLLPLRTKRESFSSTKEGEGCKLEGKKKNVEEETWMILEMLRGANLCARRETADDIFHEA